MYKATIELGAINRMMKLKFGLILQNDLKNNYNQVINRFNYSGNDYVKINPKPFITIDITSKMDKGEEWNNERTVSLNRLSLFALIKALERMILNFTKVKNLYYMDNDKLILNKIEAANIVETVLCNNKVIRLQPCVVPSDDENDDEVYEGCAFFINRIENFAYLTYTELMFLLHELKKIDMTALSLLLMETVKSYQVQNSDIKHIDNPVSEKSQEEKGMESTVKSLNLAIKKEIPDI